MNEYYRISEVASLFRVTPQTVRKYARDGKIPTATTPGGQTIYPKQDIDALLPQRPTRTNGQLVFYVRASDGDKTRLQTQIEQLTEKYGKPDHIYKDSASGLNEKRKAFNRMLDACAKGEITAIAVTNEDRLTRFGISYIERYLELTGTELLIAFDKPDKTLLDELMQDFMSLVTSFAGRFYRLRGNEQKKKLLHEAEQRLG